MKNLARWTAFLCIINSLMGCSREKRPELPVASFPSGIESGFFAPGESYRAELQGKTQADQLETQTITVSHEKQSKIATELADKIAQETQQAEQQLQDLLKQNKQLQQALRKKK